MTSREPKEYSGLSMLAACELLNATWAHPLAVARAMTRARENGQSTVLTGDGQVASVVHTAGKYALTIPS